MSAPARRRADGLADMTTRKYRGLLFVGACRQRPPIDGLDFF
jgi:hypothetical protein